MGVSEIEKRNKLEAWALRNIKILAGQEARHPYTAEEGGKAKTNPEGVLRGGQYKWYFGTGSKPEDVQKWRQKERDERKGEQRNIRRSM